MRRFFSAMMVIIAMSWANLVMANLVEINNYQLNTKEVALDATDVGGFFGTGTIFDLDPDNPISIDVMIVSDDANGFGAIITSMDHFWTFNPINFQFSAGDCTVDENKCTTFSNNGNYFNGVIVYGGQLEVFPVAKTAEAPEPSSLPLLILALALIAFAREYKYVQLSRRDARS